ncbi:MAG: hypothetical protein LBR99_05815 [Treponema sp.]|jgi:hypothetical protein|nr:hypothetical protein [Treponema sp.]
MKTSSLFTLTLSVSLFTGCFTGSPSVILLGPVPEYREQNSIIEVIDHENITRDGEGTIVSEDNMPQWVALYISTGITGIETLPEYKDSYVFVGKQAGNNLASLKLWADGFSVDRDFPRMVSARVQARFSGFARGNPGEEFGLYFEAVIKNLSDTTFSKARRESSFWIKKRIFGDDGLTPVGESYEYFILIRIDREALEEQINLFLITTHPEIPPTRDQTAAATRLRLNFYEGF